MILLLDNLSQQRCFNKKQSIFSSQKYRIQLNTYEYTYKI